MRYFDTAPHYGLGLAERRLAAGLAERDGFIVSTKVGRLLRAGDGDRTSTTRATPSRRPTSACATTAATASCASLEASLERLGLDRVDILLVHDPDEHYREALDGAFPALEELRSQGVITSYGAGMNQAEMLADFVRETDLDVVMLAGRYTLLEQGALDDLLPECERRDVSVIAAGVFNSGLLARARPRENVTYNYEPAPPECSRACTASRTCSSATARPCPRPRRSSRSPIPRWRPSASARAPPRRSSATPHCSTRRSPTRRGASSSPRACCVATLRFQWGRDMDARAARSAERRSCSTCRG